MNKLDILVTGVGGQGVVLASDIIGEVALESGYDVKKTDTLGMAQRGGSVISHVRMGPKVFSPLASEGDIDLILGFEKLEAARWAQFLRKVGVVIVNNQALPPLSVSLGKDKYPTDQAVTEILKARTEQVYFIDGSGKAAGLGNVKALNVLMLGCISAFMPIELPVWTAVIRRHLPPRLLPLNLAAFDLGRKEIESVRRR